MRIKFRIVAGVILALFATCHVAAQEEAADEFIKVLHSINAEEIGGYMDCLTSVESNGRLTGSPEYIQSAKWVAKHLKDWGYKPKGDEGTYFQWFDKPYVKVLNIGALSLEIVLENGDLIKKSYLSPDNYYAGTNSANGTVSGEVVFVGYGISAPELGYDEYAGIDVKGKIVLVSGGSPVGSKHEKYAEFIPHTSSKSKLGTAAKHGAAGMLYIGKGANPNTIYQEGFVYCHIDSTVVDDLFFNTGKVLKDLMDTAKAEFKPVSFVIGKKATITANTEFYADGRGCNVIGLLEGSDPSLKEEVILIGGHLDAVGNLGFVFPGAWDNASGVSDMMAAARALANSPVELKRSIMFIFIGGEECGMLGSRLYCEKPTVPQDKVVCYFNLDMVGTGNGMSVSGALSYPLIHKCFADANESYLHRPFRSSEARKPGIGHPRSDSQIYRRAGYVTLGFGTFGEHNKKRYYHHPEDKKETLSYDIMEDVSKLMFIGLSNMANAEKLFE